VLIKYLSILAICLLCVVGEPNGYRDVSATHVSTVLEKVVTHQKKISQADQLFQLAPDSSYLAQSFVQKEHVFLSEPSAQTQKTNHSSYSFPSFNFHKLLNETINWTLVDSKQLESLLIAINPERQSIQIEVSVDFLSRLVNLTQHIKIDA
jgi:hypothetical protein